MKDPYMIVDDAFLDDAEIAHVYERMVLKPAPDIPWFLGYRTSEVEDDHYATEDSKTHESFQMVSPVHPMTPMYVECMNLFNKFANKHGIKYKSIKRVKFNLLPHVPDYPDGMYHTPHIDTDEEHHVFLYYVNDADGDTFFFNEYFDGQEKTEFTIMDRVSPKAGKAVVFDGRIYHASSSPKESRFRIILNIDYIPE